MKWDSEWVRAAFPVLKEVTYLNTGTYGLMPEPAVTAFLEVTREFETRGVACRADLGGKMNETRKRIAGLLGAEPGEIAFTRNATDGINLVLAGLPWQPGDEVITTDEEHEAMIHPLLYLQRERGLRVRTVSVSPCAEIMLARLEEALSPRTKLVAMSHVTCETGTRLPARQICAWAAQRGVLTLFDGAQALGALPINVHELGCDFYTSNGHKWLCGPKGTGIFYMRQSQASLLFLAHVGAGSLEKADRMAGIAEPWPDARRFEFGTRAWALYAGLGAALDWFEGLGWEAVYQRVADLAGYLKARVRQCPYFHLLSPEGQDESSGLTSFTVEGLNASDLGRLLRERWNMYVRVIPHYNALRISTAHFNDEEDINRLLNALEDLWRQERGDKGG
jgi:selenocysteine lyase/cysteine desulfurase